MSVSKTNPILIAAAQRRAFVLEQRLSGATYRVIAESTIKHFGIDNLPKGYDERYVWWDVRHSLDRINKKRDEDAAELRQLEHQRLERLLLAVWPEASKGHLGAIDRAVRIIERQAALFGLEAPKRIAPVTPEGEPLTFKITEVVVERPTGGANGPLEN